MNRKNPEVAQEILSGRQVTALIALAGGRLKREAAEAAGVHPQAVSEWLRSANFRTALDSMRSALLNRASAQLEELVQDSIWALRDSLANGSPSIRLKSSMYVLDKVFAAPTTNSPDSPDESAVQTGVDEVSRILRNLGMDV